MSNKINKIQSIKLEDVLFKKDRKIAMRIDKAIKKENISKQSMKMHLLNGEHPVIVKITYSGSCINIKSKDLDDQDYYDYNIHLDSMLEGVALAEGLQNSFNKKWVYYYKKYLKKNDPTYDSSDTDQRLFEILVHSRNL